MKYNMINAVELEVFQQVQKSTCLNTFFVLLIYVDYKLNNNNI